MGRKGVSKRKPSQTKSKNQPVGTASNGNTSDVQLVEKLSTNSSSADWKKNSKKE
jgi:hypothetical protein